jgi:hypothetical protein
MLRQAAGTQNADPGALMDAARARAREPYRALALSD